MNLDLKTQRGGNLTRINLNYFLIFFTLLNFASPFTFRCPRLHFYRKEKTDMMLLNRETSLKVYVSMQFFVTSPICSFPTFINRLSIIITVSKTLWIKTIIFIRATLRPMNSLLDYLNILKGHPSVIY